MLLALSQGILVGISSAERKLTGYDLASWLGEAASGVTRGRYQSGGGGGPELLPFYTSGVVGFSGVNYALKVVTCHKRQPGSMSYVLGLLPVPAQFSFWADLALSTLVTPSSGTFAAHFAGTLAGLVSVYVPRIAGFGGRFGGRRAAAAGNRLGGRYLRDDEPRRPVRAGPNAGGGGEGGGGGRSGGGSGGGGGGRRRRGGGVGKGLLLLLASPFVFLKNAVEEGAPLVIHGGCAVACILLQNFMAGLYPSHGISYTGVSDHMHACVLVPPGPLMESASLHTGVSDYVYADLLKVSNGSLDTS